MTSLIDPDEVIAAFASSTSPIDPDEVIAAFASSIPGVMVGDHVLVVNPTDREQALIAAIVAAVNHTGGEICTCDEYVPGAE